ncbi:DUF5977 domain-containing protein [Chitinophaga sp. RAB17]|uniref:DUF5977 domain-containing protein n=1 Tax=Chitinophaga sp. RAB17 TaxID=3233049 RepID=UPI003F8DDA72
MKTVLLYCTISCITIPAVFAQGNTQTNIIPPSPVSYEFAKNGSLPISYSSGAMTFSIPVHTIKLGSQSLPLSIGYASTGVKVDMSASRIGINWNLNAGGVITRITRGIPDEQGVFWHLKDIYKDSPAGGPNMPYAANPRQYGVDTEKDWFQYNFNGYSGTFYLDDSLKAHFVNDNKLAIAVSLVSEPAVPTGDPNLAPDMDRILKFAITTPDGTKYEFGGQEYAERNFQVGFMVDDVAGYRSNTAGGNQQVYDYISTFFLKKVTNHLGGTMLFSYEKDYYKFVSAVSQNAVVGVDPKTIIIGGGSGSGGYEEVFRSESSGKICWRNFVRSRALKKIEVKQPDGSLISTINFINTDQSSFLGLDYFYTSPFYFRVINDYTAHQVMYENFYEKSPIFKTAPLRTDRIVINNSENKQVQAIQFHYDYIKQRQYLRQVLLLGESLAQLAGTDEQQYKFEYYKRDTLPQPLSSSQDYFGYFNGKVNDGLVVKPTASDNCGVSMAFINTYLTSRIFGDRNPVTNYIDCGMISRIYYPTKGFSEIVYEPNYGPDGKLYGGARVKYLRDFDGIKYSQEREFYYNELARFPDNRSSLLQTEEPRFFDKKSFVLADQFDCTLSSTSINSLYSNRKSSQTFSTVTEFFKDETGRRVGATERRYFVEAQPYPSVLQGALLFSTPASSIDAWKSELLLSQANFTAAPNGAFELKDKTEYEYIKLNEQKFLNHVVVLSGIKVPGLKSSYSINSYEIASCDFRKSKETATTYFPNGSTVLTKDYAYKNDSLVGLQSMTTKNSKGDTVVINYTYPSDVPSPSLAIKAMLNQYRIAEPVITEKLVNGQKNTTTEINYKDWGQGIVLPDKITARLGNETVGGVMDFYRYDRNGNILEQQAQNGVRETYLWGYNGQYPVAKILGADYTTISGLVNQTVLTDSSGTYSGIQIRDELNKLRTAPNAKNYFVNTYTYKPLVGMTSQTDPLNRSSFFEYDSSSRLKTVRDNENQIVKMYDFAYGVTSAPAIPGATYYSKARSAIFYKNDCAIGQVGGFVIYNLAASAFSSQISQADADQKAQTALDKNGQVYANTTATCQPATVPTPTYFNTAHYKKGFSNACVTGLSLRHTYDVPAAAYSSAISQGDADRKAFDNIQIYSQANIDTNAACISNVQPPWDGTIFNPLDNSSYSYARYFYSASLEDMKLKLKTPSLFGPIPVGIFDPNPNVKSIAVYFYPSYIIHMLKSGSNNQFAPDGYYVHTAGLVNGTFGDDVLICHLVEGALVGIDYFPESGTIVK